jgi:hypothetical protein
MPHRGWKKGERGVRGWARHDSMDHGVIVALGGAIKGGSVRSRWRRGGKQGRAVGRVRRDAADRSGRVATGLGVSGGVWDGEG